MHHTSKSKNEQYEVPLALVLALASETEALSHGFTRSPRVQSRSAARTVCSPVDPESFHEI